jgi:hypothetical protein
MDWDQWGALIFTGVYTILASAGFWKFFSQRQKEKDAEIQLLLGLSREIFHYIGATYIDRGWVSSDEYENLITHIYTPYKTLGGNSTADKIMEDVSELPFRANASPKPFDERVMRRAYDPYDDDVKKAKRRDNIE